MKKRMISFILAAVMVACMIPFGAMTVFAENVPIDAPTAVTGLVYTGETLTGVAEGTGYTLEGNTATDAGTYYATATPKAGYAWKDPSFNGTIEWSIEKATPTVKVWTSIEHQYDNLPIWVKNVSDPSGADQTHSVVPEEDAGGNPIGRYVGFYSESDGEIYLQLFNGDGYDDVANVTPGKEQMLTSDDHFSISKDKNGDNCFTITNSYDGWFRIHVKESKNYKEAFSTDDGSVRVMPRPVNVTAPNLIFPTWASDEQIDAAIDAAIRVEKAGEIPDRGVLEGDTITYKWYRDENSLIGNREVGTTYEITFPDYDEYEEANVTYQYGENYEVCYVPGTITFEDPSNAARITAEITVADFSYEMVIPTTTTLTEANHENVLLGTDGKVSITNIKHPTDKVNVVYTVDLSNGTLTDGTNTINATYKYKQGANNFTAIDGTTKVTVYANKTVNDSFVNVTANSAQWNAAPAGTYNASVTFNFAAEEAQS